MLEMGRAGAGLGWAGGRPYNDGGLRLLMKEEINKREKTRDSVLYFVIF
jgi:hypothetical protein